MNTLQTTEELTLKMLDGIISDAEEQHLLELIKDPQCKKAYLEIIDLEVALKNSEKIDNSDQIAAYVDQSLELESQVMNIIDTLGPAKKDAKRTFKMNRSQKFQKTPKKTQIPFQRIFAFAASFLVFSIVAYWVMQSQKAPQEPVIGKIKSANGEIVLQGPGKSLTPKEGTVVRNGNTLSVAEGSNATFQYLDGTELRLAAGTEVQYVQSNGQKSIFIRKGKVFADVMKQPKGKPFILSSESARAEVVGTKLNYWVSGTSARLDVTQGTVRFVSLVNNRSLDITAGTYAVVEKNIPFKKRDLKMSFHFAEGKAKAQGKWSWLNGQLIQKKFFPKPIKTGDPYPISSYISPCDPTEDLVFSATATTMDSQKFPANVAPWGFGLILGNKNRCVVFRLVDNKFPEKGLEFAELSYSALIPPSKKMEYEDYGMKTRGIPFKGKVTYSYQLKVSAKQVDDHTYLLKGKCWEKNTPEPHDWMLVRTVKLRRPITQVGFQTTHLACEFTDISLKDTTGIK